MKNWLTGVLLVVFNLSGLSQTDIDGFALLNDRFTVLGTDTIPVFEDTICLGNTFTLQVHKGGAEQIHGVTYSVLGESYSELTNFLIDSTGYFTIKVEADVTVKNNLYRGVWVDYFYVHVNYCPPLVNLSTSAKNTCQNTCITYRNTSTNYPTSYEWRFEGGQPPLWSDSLPPPVCYPDTGTFTTTLIVSNPAGADTALKTIHVAGGPFPIPVEHSFLINEGDSVTLSACAKGNGYNWAYEPSIITNFDTVVAAQPDEAQTYLLTVTENGCEVLCSYTVYVKNGLLVPTAFSPNNDGVNDVFRILNTNIKLLNLAIYNRWGEQVFYSTDIQDGWDGIYKGIPQPLGSFVWVCNYEIIKTRKRKSAKGNVTLLR